MFCKGELICPICGELAELGVSVLYVLNKDNISKRRPGPVIVLPAALSPVSPTQ